MDFNGLAAEEGYFRWGRWRATHRERYMRVFNLELDSTGADFGWPLFHQEDSGTVGTNISRHAITAPTSRRGRFLPSISFKMSRRSRPVIAQMIALVRADVAGRVRLNAVEFA